MRPRLAFATALLLALPPTIAARESSALVPIPPAAEILSRVRPEHPRLLLNQAHAGELRSLLQRSPRLADWHRRLLEQAGGILKASPSHYEIPDGKRLLSVSRRVLDRVYTLALLHHIDGAPQWKERLWAELSAAAGFKDWNPAHFLDTAEMSHAFAIGYDWLFATWTENERRILREALVEKGLRLGVEAYRSRPSYGWWTRVDHNWNQVCNGGIGMAALALAETHPELAGEFLHHALASIQMAMAQYGPDGAWAEGPAYWNYATSYNVVFLAALQSALGTDFNLNRIPGFHDAGLFPIYINGPLDRTFNYADGGDGTIRSPSLFWMARQFERPDYARYQNRVARGEPLDLLWGDPGLDTGPLALPLDKWFRNADVVTFRSHWSDPNAVFVGFKGGDNRANHSHLDLGTFVLDAKGVRWAEDLGADDYNLPGYFGPARWTYYRLRAEGHNTLVLNPGPDPDQDPSASAPIVHFQSTPNRSFAIADLTPAYARHAESVRRGIALLNRRSVVIRDEIRLREAGDAWWFFHTRSEVTLLSRGSARLSQDGHQVALRILEPESAEFMVQEAKPLPGSPEPASQNPNRGLRRLSIRSAGVTDLPLTVSIETEGGGVTEAETALALRPLSDW